MCLTPTRMNVIPSAKRVLVQSGLMARGVTLHPRIARGLRNLLAPRLLGRHVYVTPWRAVSRAPHCDTTMGVERTGSSVPAPPKPHCGMES